MHRPALKVGLFLMVFGFAQGFVPVYAQNFSSTGSSTVKSEAAATKETAMPVTVASTATVTVEDLKAMAQQAQPVKSDVKSGFDPLKFTLGPEDVVEVSVMRHPEFSGT